MGEKLFSPETIKRSEIVMLDLEETIKELNQLKQKLEKLGVSL